MSTETVSAPINAGGESSAKPTGNSASSIHLDAIRGVAALLVFVQHLRNLFFVDYDQSAHKGMLQRGFYFMSGLGHEAVMIFFVLSGYFIVSSVIRSVQTGRWSWNWYASQRLTRLYVVLIPALLLGGILDHLGARIFGLHGVYGGGGQYQAMTASPITNRDTLGTALANFLFLQGILAPSYGSNGALWSLSYEFWYYVAFPLLFLATVREAPLARRVAYIALCAAALCFVGKTIALFFLIWLLGWGVQHFGSQKQRGSWERPLVVALGIAWLGSLAAGRLGIIHSANAASFVIGGMFSLFLIFLLRTSKGVSLRDGLYPRVARSLSGISYSLYLLHTPALFFLNGLIIKDGRRWPLDPKHAAMALGIAAIVLLYVWIVWRYTEANTPLIRRLITSKNVSTGTPMRKNAGKIQLLENIRGLAALYVFLGHVVIGRLGLKSGAFGFLFRFGQEAVMLFFLLSGFVIYYSFSKSKDQSFSGYFIRRFRRIYPIFILSLAVSYFVACQAAHTWVPLDTRDLLGNLFMLQDFKGGKPGVWFETYGNDAPLWSLSYEWWFYMMFFPIITRIPVAKQRFLTFGLSLVGFVTYWLHPNAPSLYLWYFVIWWSGVEAARVYGAGEVPSLRNMRTQLILLVSMCVPQLLAVLVWKKVLHRSLGFGIHPVLELRHFLFSALVFVLALCSTSMSRERLHKLLQPFAILAPISYGIYVLHYPITIEGRFLNGLHNRWIEAAAYCAVALGVAWFAEIPYQSLMNRWIRVPSPKPAPVTLSRGEETPIREREGVNVE